MNQNFLFHKRDVQMAILLINFWQIHFQAMLTLKDRNEFSSMDFCVN